MSRHAESIEPWRARWLHGQTAWDLAGAHKLLPALVDLARGLGWRGGPARFLVPGCGRAHDAAYLAREGHEVKAIDFVPEAIAEAEKAHGSEPRLTLAVEDALRVAADERDAFDAIYDRAMLCALAPENRRAYVEACRERLVSGGLFMTISFAELTIAAEKGPPYAIDLPAMLAMFSEGFSLVAAETRRDGHCDKVISSELLCIWKRK